MSERIEEVLRETGVYVSTTSGRSMYPMLRDRRDRVVIKVVTEHPLRKYDLPLYKREDGAYVLHRILKVKDGYYIIRGDNTFAPERVPFSAVLGCVSEFYRGDRHVDANARSYRFYAAFWHFLYPVRVLYRKMRRGMRRLLGKKK